MFKSDKFYITDIWSVIYVNSSSHPSTRSYYRGNIPAYELAYRISGENITTFNKKSLHNLPGVVEFLPKGIKNAEYYVDKISDGECINIFFDTNCPIFDEPFIVDTSLDSQLRMLFTKFYQIWIGRKHGYYFECMSILYQILYRIIKINQVYLPQNLFTTIEKGINYIHEHCFDENLLYTECAKICSISYSYFKRLFIKKFEVTPCEYVTSLRMKYACELLNTKRYSITEISETVGYKNVYYFSKVFKKSFGISPTEYMKKESHQYKWGLKMKKFILPVSFLIFLLIIICSIIICFPSLKGDIYAKDYGIFLDDANYAEKNSRIINKLIRKAKKNSKIILPKGKIYISDGILFFKKSKITIEGNNTKIINTLFSLYTGDNLTNYSNSNILKLLKSNDIIITGINLDYLNCVNVSGKITDL